MKQVFKTSVAFVTAFMMAFTGAFMFNGISNPVYADVGSVADDEDITYDKDGGILSDIGVDTSKMPDDYNPDSTSNPYGSDVTNLKAVSELVKFETTENKARLFGHNKNLDGKYETFIHTSDDQPIPLFSEKTFLAAKACDLKGTGKKSALAIVYTNYNHAEYEQHPEQNNIYLVLFDPHAGTWSEPIQISKFIEDRVEKSFIVQSQLQVACGDFDNDSVDEIAVYAPAETDSQRARVAVYDLIKGKNAADPFSVNAWQQSWNYVLPTTSSASEIVAYEGESTLEYFRNFYNNIDLTAGDADNDGICDLIVSYGASSTGAETGAGSQFSRVIRSLESNSVLLYGSDSGQMLKRSQKIDYQNNSLIRVSFAFGDLDDDGNEEMILGGQPMDEQGANTSRVLGKYTYDSGSKTMIPEVVQKLNVVDGEVNDGEWASANGWDRNYYSTPVMKTNIAVGKFFGSQSAKRIYMDSVLYSFDNTFAIEDELEDTTTEKDKNNKDVPMGSQAMANIKHAGRISQCEYYEFGALAADFTGGDIDYAAVSRVSARRGLAAGPAHIEAVATLLVAESSDPDDPDNLDKLQLYGKHSEIFDLTEVQSSPYFLAAPDTDIDGTIAEYTGNHEIVYTDPKVLAVLASAPYFKDVAAYDEGNMLNWCSTAFGKTDGTERGYEHSFTFEIGATASWDFKNFWMSGSAGYHLNMEWGEKTTQNFTMSYDTAGGEDAVVLYSVPDERFEYKVTSIMVDDDGTIHPFEDKMYIEFPHRPVAQTLLLDDYKEIQKRYSKNLPDVTKYFSSTPGDPSSYPKSENDIPKDAKDKLATYKDYPEDDDHKSVFVGNEWAGVAYGSGRVTQTISRESTTTASGDSIMSGGWGTVEVGGQFGVPSVWNVKIGGHTQFAGDEGSTFATTGGTDFTGTVANMPRDAKDYGYDFSWKLLTYGVKYSKDCTFPVVTYIVDDVLSPPSLPDEITQDFDNTTDSQTALTWDYNSGTPKEFKVYKYLDFPQGGGDLLVGTVDGSDYKIKKDENGKTVTDSKGNVVHEYTFIDKDLSPDTKYKYRLKVVRSKFPQESIFSPVIEARTDVSQKPDVSLTTDNLKIYPDGVYNVAAVVADPEHYEGTINYQWQKYDTAKRVWSDVTGCNTRTISFFKCQKVNEGLYRCRVNLIRKVESHPQYISTYTDTCTVSYSKRSVVFGDISVFDGTGNSPTNTGISVTLNNSSASSVEKPTGSVLFKIEGASSIINAQVPIDEAKGLAKINSIEDCLDSTLDLADFGDGGYKVTATYLGSNIFYAADDPKEYHYLRNIKECTWLSAKNTYIFSEDIMETARLYDYKKDAEGKVTRTDVTDTVTEVKIYAADEEGHKTGNVLRSYTLATTGGKAPLPLIGALAKNAFVEVYTDDTNTVAGSASFKTEKMKTKLILADRLTGTGGNMPDLYTDDDITLEGDGSLTEKNIVANNQDASLAELLRFRYYEENGDFMFDSSEAAQHKSEFIPAAYIVKLAALSPVKTFYDLTLAPADFTVVGNYYKVKAACADRNEGVVSMLSPDVRSEYTENGYAGGTKLIFKAVPEKGFKVKGWRINECGTNQYTLGASDTITYMVKSETATGTGEVTITAILEPKNNTLTYASKGEGTVTVSPEIQSGSTVLADTALTFTATPADGWKFKEWRWNNAGGSNSIAKGTFSDDGRTNSKTFKMSDSSAALYGIFMRETVDIDLSGDITASYINSGGNPLEEIGSEVNTDNGQDVPKESQVILKAKPGYGLASGAAWDVAITTPAGTHPPADLEEFISDGREACRFTLPDDATACTAGAETVKGNFSIDADAEDVDFVIKVDGVVQEGLSVSGIAAGSNVEITALPARGKVLKSWTVNGKTMETNDPIYMTAITENLSVSATTANDEKVSLKLKAEGGGTAQYTITDKNGKTYTDTFGSTQITPVLYKGESLTVGTAKTETANTITAISLNGEEQPLDEGMLTLDGVTDSADIVCRFMPSNFCTVGFADEMRSTQSLVLDENDLPVDIVNGETIAVPKGAKAVFKIVAAKDCNCSVYNGDNLLPEKSTAAYDDQRNIWTYELDNVTQNTTLTVRDYSIFMISTKDDLVEYFTLLSQHHGPGCPDAALKRDIVFDDLPMALLESLDNQDSLTARPESGNGVTVIPQNHVTFDGVFDGNGHTIKNAYLFPWLFYNVGETGCIKDVLLENSLSLDIWTTDKDYAVLTKENHGTISGVTLKNARMHIAPSTGFKAYYMAGIAGVNEGTIADCMVSGLMLTTNETPTFTDPIGCAGVLVNQAEETGKAVMENNYFEGLALGDALGRAHDATGSIVADPTTGVSHGTFKDNYFRATEEATDPNGTSVYTLSDHPERYAFAREFAYMLNHLHQDSRTVWGVPPAPAAVGEPAGIMQVALGGDIYKAPIKVTFNLPAKPEKNQTLHIYPGDCELPGQAAFGDDTPTAWSLGNRAYSPNYKYVELVEDSAFTGIYQDDLADYEASLTYTDNNENQKTIYFKSLDDALTLATLHNTGNSQYLEILGNCKMTGKSFTIDAATVMTVKDGAALTIDSSTQITNNGVLDFAQGSTTHKYGTIQNNNSMIVAGTFYNYGSLLAGKGTISGRSTIICKPHCTGEWIQSDKPNADGTWDLTTTCSVCGKAAISKKIDPNPPESAIKSIALLTNPAKMLYNKGDAFTDEGMLVMALLRDGTKAVITKASDDSQNSEDAAGYTLSCDGQPIKNGDILDTEGVPDITVNYGSFTCEFEIEVIDRAGMLSITDQNGHVITEDNPLPEMTSGGSVKLSAALKHKLAEKYGFRWESSDPDVAVIEDNSLKKDRTILAGKTGKATVTVTVVDENNRPIAGIDPKTVDITVVHHITDLKILGGDKTIDAGDTIPIALEVTPADTTDEIVWSSTNENVATVEGVVTRDGQGRTIWRGDVTGCSGGKATITAMSPGGVSSSCKVTVYEKAGELILDASNLPIALNGFAVLSARVTPPTANGEVTWTTDDVSTAGFYVKNRETGEMEVVDTLTTKLSADGKESSDAYVIIAGVGNKDDGQAVITASTQGRDGSTLTQDCTVTVSASANSVTIGNNGVAVSGKTLSLDLEGRMIQFYAESVVNGQLDPADPVTWSVIDDGVLPVIRVDNNGRVDLLREGTAAVKVSSDTTGATDVCMISVRIVPTEVRLSEKDLTMTKRDHQVLTATLLPEGAGGDLTWTSTDPSVATVSAAGEITAVGAGTAEISASISPSGPEATCKVTVKEPLYTVEFTDGLGKTLKTQTVEEGQAATPPDAPTREGYSFDGWDKSFENVLSDLTVNAKWKANTFTVKFTNGLGKTLKTQTVREGQAATPPDAPTREGYSFNGWDKSFESVLSDLTVNAKWKVNTFTVKFVDGLGKTLKTQTVKEGQAATAPKSPTKAGYRKGYYFSGWDKSCLGVTTDLIITALWKKQISIKNAKVVLSKTAYTYNGKVQKPKVKTIGGKALKAGTDYTIKWSASKPKNVGPYTVTITGKGKYAGKTKAKFKINPKGTKIKKLKAGKKTINVKWKKLETKMAAARVTGYQIQVSTSKKFTEIKKSVFVKGYKKESKTIKKLKAGKKYYVRVRTYTQIKDVKYYSPWSKVMKVKTKKKKKK